MKKGDIMNNKELSVNFRWGNKESYLFAVIGKKIGDKYTCYDMNSGEHFEADRAYISTTQTVLVQSTSNDNVMVSQLKRAGYENIRVINRMQY